MNKRGFTLIELLSVIIVLALILIIAIPRILNVVEETEKESFRITGENLVRQARDRTSIDSMGNPSFKTYIIEENEFMGESLPVSGKLPNNGVIEVDEDGNVYLEIRNEKYCAKKDYDSQQVLVTKDKENCIIEIPLTNDCFEISDMSATEIEITGYNNSCPLDVTIPSEISGKTVVRIGDEAFYNNQLTSVTLPSSVKNIGSGAFYNNQLTSITLPSSVTSMDSRAFYNNQLTSITLPSSVTNIGYAAFNNNQLPDNQAFIYERKTDGSEDKTNIVSYGGAKRDNIIIPSSVTNIGYAAFENNQLTSITLPSSVTSMGDYAFRDNQLTSVTLPSSVTNIGYGAFYNNQLTSVVIPSSVTSIGTYAFYNNQLTSITLPSSVTSIGNSAFAYNQLTSVVIPSSVTSMGDYAFYNNQLTSVTLPSSVTNIGYAAFYNNQLTSITLPSSVTSIGDYAFSVNQLTSITIPSSVAIINSSISSNFYTSYVIDNNKAGGTYTAPSQNGVWTKQ